MRRRITLTLDIDLDAYEENYGRRDDAAEYAAELITDDAVALFEMLDWATIVTVPLRKAGQ